MARHHELEWQFAARDFDATREWIARQPAARSERRFAARTTLELSDRYYDTPDWMIFRAGFALRVRQTRDEDTENTEVTLKSLSDAKHGLASRVEFTERIAGADLSSVLTGDSEIGARIRELAGNRTLMLLFHARTRRERQQLLEADSELPLAEVDLDQTSIEAPSGAVRELHRIEVECINAEPGVLAPLIAELCAAAQLAPSQESKFRAGLSTAGLEPRVMPAAQFSAPLAAADPFAKSRIVILGRLFSTALDCEPRVRSGDPGAVHDMRVALRRLLVLSKVIPGRGAPWIARARIPVRALVKSLGTVRDCDVQLEYLSAEAARRDPEERQAIAPLRDRLEHERKDARRALLAQLDSESTRGWIDAWRAELTREPPADAAADSTARVADNLVRAQARKLRKRADRLGRHSSPAEYHEVRIRAKRLRYTLDAFAELYGAPAQDFLRALARLQDLLGTLHDASVRAERFAAAAASAQLPAATTFVMGRIVENDARSLEECRVRFPKAYRRVRRRRWRALRALMKTLASGAN